MTVGVIGGTGFPMVIMLFIAIACIAAIGAVVIVGISLAMRVRGDNKAEQVTATAEVIEKGKGTAAFRLEGGTSIKLKIKDADSGSFAEGDVGLLEFKGTRYISFRRR